MTIKNVKGLVCELKEKWLKLHELPGVFAYTLNVQKRKYLPEERWKFYAEYNPDRSNLRRLPQTIQSLDPVFNDDQFNFKKIQSNENLLNIPYKSDAVAMIINRSPLTTCHTLICPALDKGHSQRITLYSLEFCVSLLRNLNDSTFRIGYNSPGALASVNHLHWHLLCIEKELYIDRVKLDKLSSASNFVYRLSSEMPTEAICFIIQASDTDLAISAKLERLYNFIEWLIKNNIPHNLFLTLNTEANLCIYIFAREKYCVVKDLNTCNIGFGELSGYVPIGDKQQFDMLTEEDVITKIQEETGNVYERVYSYLMNDIL